MILTKMAMPLCSLLVLAILIIAKNVEGVPVDLKGKKTYQSSDSVSSGKAIDGCKKTDFKEGCCTKTTKGDGGSSWWSVDLGEEQMVSSVTLTARGDCCPKELKGVSIFTSLSSHDPNDAKKEFCRYSKKSLGLGKTKKMNCKKVTSARYVIIETSQPALTLCEVAIDAKNEQKGLEKRVDDLEDRVDTIEEDGLLQPHDCRDIRVQDSSLPSGLYTIRLYDGSDLEVYCDFDTDESGWLVFQRRINGSERFYRPWKDYEKGFGSKVGEFWLGNDNLAKITNGRTYQLRVDLQDFDNVTKYAIYSEFRVESTDNYRLTLGAYSGTAGDGMKYLNQRAFSTFDRDNDAYSTNLAGAFKGAWWYYHPSYTYSNLNGMYLHGVTSSNNDGMTWYFFKGYRYSLKFTEMKLRPVY